MRNLDRDTAHVDWARSVERRLDDLAGVARRTLRRTTFATTSDRDADPGPWAVGDLCYVASVTIGGHTGDAEYVRTASGWKLWTFPMSTAEVALYTPTLTAITTNPTLGTAGAHYGTWRMDRRIVRGMVRTYWGTTNGTPGAGGYLWSLPCAAHIGSGQSYGPIGSAGYNDPTAGRMWCGWTQVLTTADPTHVGILLEHTGFAVGTSGTPLYGLAGSTYYGSFEYPALFSAI